MPLWPLGHSTGGRRQGAGTSRWGGSTLEAPPPRIKTKKLKESLEGGKADGSLSKEWK